MVKRERRGKEGQVGPGEPPDSGAFFKDRAHANALPAGFYMIRTTREPSMTFQLEQTTGRHISGGIGPPTVLDTLSYGHPSGTLEN